MRAKQLWLPLAVAVGVALGYWWKHRVEPTAPSAAALTPATSASSGTPAVASIATPPVVAIQDQKTIDFSNGKAVISYSAQDKAIIDTAVKEMNDATKDITFGPTPAATDSKKTAEPEKTPSK